MKSVRELCDRIEELESELLAERERLQTLESQLRSLVVRLSVERVFRNASQSADPASGSTNDNKVDP